VEESSEIDEVEEEKEEEDEDENDGIVNPTPAMKVSYTILIIKETIFFLIIFCSYIIHISLVYELSICMLITVTM